MQSSSNATQQRKRKRSSTSPTNRLNERRHPFSFQARPDFLDSTAVVSVAKFTARRLPEMKSLWRQHVVHTFLSQDEGEKKTPIKHPEYAHAVKNLKSQGGKVNQERHLRRRTTSYLPRRRHRFPTADGVTQNDKGVSILKWRARRNPRELRSCYRDWWNIGNSETACY